MEDIIKLIFCISFIVLCFVNISLMLLGYYHECKEVKRFESMRKKENNND